MGIIMGLGMKSGEGIAPPPPPPPPPQTKPRKRKSVSSRPQNPTVKPLPGSSSRPRTAPARFQKTPRKLPKKSISPYSPQHRFSPRLSPKLSPKLSPSANNSRPQTAGEPVVLNCSTWATRPMPSSSSTSRSDSSRSFYEDRETLVKELVDLKKMVAQQNRQCKKQKIRTSAAEHENLKLERDLVELEMKGIADDLVEYDSPFLREKLQGLKTRLSYLQKTCRFQADEVSLLRRDVRGTHTKELEMERDVFEDEAYYLQRVVRKLADILSRLSSDNKEIMVMKEKNVKLKETNLEMQRNMGTIFNALQKVNSSLTLFRARASDAVASSRRYVERIKDVRRRAGSIETMIQSYKDRKYQCQLRVPVLKRKLEASRKELGIILVERDKARANKMKEFLENHKAFTPRLQCRPQKPGRFIPEEPEEEEEEVKPSEKKKKD